MPIVCCCCCGIFQTCKWLCEVGSKHRNYRSGMFTSTNNAKQHGSGIRAWCMQTGSGQRMSEPKRSLKELKCANEWNPISSGAVASLTTVFGKRRRHNNSGHRKNNNPSNNHTNKKRREPSATIVEQGRTQHTPTSKEKAETRLFSVVWLWCGVVAVGLKTVKQTSPVRCRFAGRSLWLCVVCDEKRRPATADLPFLHCWNEYIRFNFSKRSIQHWEILSSSVFLRWHSRNQLSY